MSTIRAQTRANLKVFLDDFKAAQPTLLQTYRNRPASFGSTPCAYVGGISEPRILHTAGIRQRDIEASLVLVDTLTDNEETADRLDVLVDALIDALTAQPHVVDPETVQAPTRVEPVELDAGGVPYAAVVVTALVQAQEGRT